METSKRIVKRIGIGDAAVEGLMYGVLAGAAMAVFVLVVELTAGKTPGVVLGYFDASHQASPFGGLFTHIAVSGIYGVVFGIVTMLLARMPGARVTLGMWLLLGAMYGVFIFGVATWIVLPRTVSALRELPIWVLAGAHLMYGVSLGWLVSRTK